MARGGRSFPSRRASTTIREFKVFVPGTDQAALSESVSVVVTITVTDSAALSESAFAPSTSFPAGTDLFTFGEFALLAISVSDSGTLADSGAAVAFAGAPNQAMVVTQAAKTVMTCEVTHKDPAGFPISIP